ncbi:MAG: DUF4164 domain-containing protein [Hyphomicrobiales bacterium]|nr:DUF4164 domain-containing protein [Hyphomicrobiales bacterium]
MVDDIIGEDENEVERFLQQLGSSLEKLESVVEGHLESKIINQDYAAEVQRMGADRSRLAGSLDDAEARCQRLENVNREVSSRLVNAMETIRGVIDKSPRS